jgi:mono/diheme cytochrome c family protein
MKTLIAFIAGLVAAPLLLVIAGMLGWLGSTGTANPPAWEASLGDRLLETALEKRSSGLKNPIASNDGAALAAGQKLYVKDCAGCHGSSAGPSPWGSKGFYPRAPQFWQSKEGHEQLKPEEAFAAIHDGIRYTGMGAWRDLMKDEDMWKVANFVARIHELRADSANGLTAAPQPGAKK